MRAVSLCPAGMSHGDGKFIAIGPIEGPAELLVFALFSQCQMHKEIVACWEKKTGGSRFDKGWRVLGGGYWRLDEGILHLHGNSGDFGAFDRRLVQETLPVGTVFGEKQITIE